MKHCYKLDFFIFKPICLEQLHLWIDIRVVPSSPITSAFVSTLSITTMFGWFAITCLSGCSWKVLRILAGSFSTTFSYVSHSELRVSSPNSTNTFLYTKPTTWLWCNTMPYLRASYSLCLLCAGLSQGLLGSTCILPGVIDPSLYRSRAQSLFSC